MAIVFDITPEERASASSFLKRQLFRKTSLVTRAEVDLEGKTAIVTGSNTGIGLECSRQLLDLGVSQLILAVRSPVKGEAAKAQLLAGRESKMQTIDVLKLDLADYDSILDFVERIKSLERLDIFVHNAGIVNSTLQLNSKTGHDEVMQTNYLSLVLLTVQLLPILKEKSRGDDPGRLVFVSSETSSWSAFKERHSTPILPAFDKEEGFVATDRYWTSKLLGQLFLLELAKRVPPSVAVINAPNPGLCYGSSLMSQWDNTVLGFFVGIATRLIGRSTALGARAITDAAVRHGQESHGHYLEDGKIQPMAPIVYTPEGAKVAKQLWDETMQELAFANVAETIQKMNSKP